MSVLAKAISNLTNQSEWSQVVRELPDNKDVNKEAEESMALEPLSSTDW
jgi:hypothetical protein